MPLPSLCPPAGGLSDPKPGFAANTERGSGHEEVLGRTNPQESDSIWEKGKKAYQMNRTYFRFNVGSTATLVWLLLVLFVQRINHRRAEDRMVHAIADALAQDARTREEARQAIKRYNDHIEACDRMIEERERLAAASSDKEDVESRRTKWNDNAAANHHPGR
jgi:hypothetical protein